MTMTSAVAICNLALSNIGKANISAIDEASAEARACAQFYDLVRDLLLMSFPWSFATKTQALARVDNDKEDWAFAFEKPTDCLKALAVNDERKFNWDGTTRRWATKPFSFEGQNVYSDVDPCYMTYTYRLEDPTKYSPAFIDTFGWHLAVRLAMPITRDPKLRIDCLEMAGRMWSLAAFNDANQERRTYDVPSDLIESRG